MMRPRTFWTSVGWHIQIGFVEDNDRFGSALNCALQHRFLAIGDAEFEQYGVDAIRSVASVLSDGIAAVEASALALAGRGNVIGWKDSEAINLG
jgi:hypothetical protein